MQAPVGLVRMRAQAEHGAKLRQAQADSSSCPVTQTLRVSPNNLWRATRATSAAYSAWGDVLVLHSGPVTKHRDP